ncbi:MAG TPA: hypothetical protein VF067_07355 [Sphingomicrobium sp.]
MLGPETGPLGLPCAISVPNLIPDRGLWVAGRTAPLNVRRLMYQTLIRAGVLGDDARSLAATLDSEGMESAPNALVDGVRRDVELGRDLLRRQMLIDEEQTVELSRAQPRYASS